MKKVIFLFALLFSLAFSAGTGHPGYVKEKTEQSAALVTSTTSSFL